MRIVIFGLLLSFFIVYPGSVQAQDKDKKKDEVPASHEYIDIKRVDLSEVEDYLIKKVSGRTTSLQKLPNFVLEDTTGKVQDFYKFLKGKNIVLLTFLRADCPNSHFELPNIEKNYEKFKSKGFDVFSIMEYSSDDLLKNYLTTYNPGITTTLGTRTKEDEDIRFLTDHYRLRKSLGDTRKWGTPFSFLIKDGDLRNVWYVGGEFNPGDLEKFLEENL